MVHPIDESPWSVLLAVGLLAVYYIQTFLMPMVYENALQVINMSDLFKIVYLLQSSLQ